MASVRLWPLWLRSLVLLWGRAGMGLGLGLAPPTATAPPAPAQACSEFSQRSCEECLKNVSCLWCYTNNTCIDYPVRSILPPSSLCSLSNARWGVCWINFEALIIAIAVVAGLILVSVAVCCCYCCYCRRRSRSKPEMAKFYKSSNWRISFKGREIVDEELKKVSQCCHVKWSVFIP
uniref:PTTG1 interacting protein n=1 Tax=Falco tinnunculus TaxID=100819 RepID=A0A8C4XUW1_FALTI